MKISMDTKQQIAMLLFCSLLFVNLFAVISWSQRSRDTTIANQFGEDKLVSDYLPVSEIKWSFYLVDSEYGRPRIADVDDDGELEVLIATNTIGRVYCLNAITGDIEWSTQLSYSTSEIAIADVDEDGDLEVIVGGGRLYCLDGATGAVDWEYAKQTYGSPCIADFDAEAGLEIVIATTGPVECVFGKNGTMLWDTPDIEAYWYRSSPSAADLDNDGKLEVAIGTDNGSIYSLNGSTGFVEWKFNTGGSVDCATTIADIDQDGVLEVIVGTDEGAIYNLNGTDGSMNWQYPLATYTFGGRPVVVDVDDDGVMEVIVVASDDSVHCINGITGSKDWSYDIGTTSGYLYRSVAVADIDGDRALDVIVASQDGLLHDINGKTGLRESFITMWPNVIYSSPVLADIDFDGLHEIFITASDTLHCWDYAGPTPESNYYPWPGVMPGGDMRGTGCFVDSDNDNLTDIFEITVGCDPYSNDSDGDGGLDYEELLLSTDPSDGIWYFPVSDWIVDLEGLVTFGGPTIADVTPEEGLEVIMGYMGNAYCVSGMNGSVIWNYTTSSEFLPIESSVGDVNGDGHVDVLLSTGVAATTLGGVYCLNGSNGAYLWNYTIPGWVNGACTIYDIDNDGKMEVYFASGDNETIYCLHGENGTRIWSYKAPDYVATSPVLGDVDNDNELEFAFGCHDNKVYCLNAQGQHEWNYTTSDVIMGSDCVIVDINQDGKNEVIVGSYDSNVHCIHGENGTMMWKRAIGDWITGTPLVADVDSDSDLEVVIGSIAERLYCINSTGHVEWYVDTGEDISGTACFADIDGDHEGEILFTSDTGYMYCLNGTGYEEWRYYTGFTNYRGSIPVGDVDEDGQLEAIAASYILAGGKIFCIRVGSSPFFDDAYLWPGIEAFADSDHTCVYIDDDHDGLPNGYEKIAGSSPIHVDEDTDGRDDYSEFLGSTNPTHDDVNPGTITNLATINVHENNVTLTWTARGDNGGSGRATSYHVRYSTTGPIEDIVDWNAATAYSQSWTPVSPGTTESRVLANLNLENEVWFAVRTLDEDSNMGDISNSPSAIHVAYVDDTPPAAIVDLIITDFDSGSMTLSWTAPGDDGTIGISTGYVVKYSSKGPITSSNWDSAHTYTQEWVPLEAGSEEVHTLSDLNESSSYWFSIIAFDEIPNYAEVSNIAYGVTSVEETSSTTTTTSTTTGTTTATNITAGLSFEIGLLIGVAVGAGAIGAIIVLIVVIQKKRVS